MNEENVPISLKEDSNSTTQQREPKTGKLFSTYDSETTLTSSSAKPPAPKDSEVEKVMTFNSADSSDSKGDGRKAVSTVEQEEFREHVLSSKMESDKTLKHLIEIKVDVSACMYLFIFTSLKQKMGSGQLMVVEHKTGDYLTK